MILASVVLTYRIYCIKIYNFMLHLTSYLTFKFHISLPFNLNPKSCISLNIVFLPS